VNRRRRSLLTLFAIDPKTACFFYWWFQFFASQNDSSDLLFAWCGISMTCRRCLTCIIVHATFGFRNFSWLSHQNLTLCVSDKRVLLFLHHHCTNIRFQSLISHLSVDINTNCLPLWTHAKGMTMTETLKNKDEPLVIVNQHCDLGWLPGSQKVAGCSLWMGHLTGSW